MKSVLRRILDKWIKSHYDFEDLYLSLQDGHLRLTNVSLNDDCISELARFLPLSVNSVELSELSLLIFWAKLFDDSTLDVAVVTIDKLTIICSDPVDAPVFYDAQSSILEDISDELSEDYEKGIVETILYGCLSRTKVILKEVCISLPDHYSIAAKNSLLRFCELSGSEFSLECYCLEIALYLEHQRSCSFSQVLGDVSFSDSALVVDLSMVRADLYSTKPFMKDKAKTRAAGPRKASSIIANIKVASSALADYGVNLFSSEISYSSGCLWAVTKGCYVEAGDRTLIVDPVVFSFEMGRRAVYCLCGDLSLFPSTHEIHKDGADRHLTSLEDIVLKEAHKVFHQILQLDFDFFAHFAFIDCGEGLLEIRDTIISKKHDIIAVEIAQCKARNTHASCASSDIGLELSKKDQEYAFTHGSSFIEVFSPQRHIIDDLIFIEPQSSLLMQSFTEQFILTALVKIKSFRIDIYSAPKLTAAAKAESNDIILLNWLLSLQIERLCLKYDSSLLQFQDVSVFIDPKSLWISSINLTTNTSHFKSLNARNLAIAVSRRDNILSALVEGLDIEPDPNAVTEAPHNRQGGLLEGFDTFVTLKKIACRLTLCGEKLRGSVDCLRFAKQKARPMATIFSNIGIGFDETPSFAEINFLRVCKREITLGLCQIYLETDSFGRIFSLVQDVLDSLTEVAKQDPVIRHGEQPLTFSLLESASTNGYTGKDLETPDHFASRVGVSLNIDSADELWLEGLDENVNNFIDVPEDIIRINNSIKLDRSPEDSVNIFGHPCSLHFGHFKLPTSIPDFPWTIDSNDSRCYSWKLLDGDLKVHLEDRAQILIEDVKAQISYADDMLRTCNVLLANIVGSTSDGTIWISRNDNSPFVLLSLALLEDKQMHSTDSEYNLDITLSNFAVILSTTLIRLFLKFRDSVATSECIESPDKKKASLYFSTIIVPANQNRTG